MPWEDERYDMYCDTFDEVESNEKAEREAGYKRESRVRYKSGKNAASASSGRPARGRRGEGKGGGVGGKDEGLKTTRVPKAGTQRMEAKLETKSHRRQSRRSKNMETMALGQEDDVWDDAAEYGAVEEDLEGWMVLEDEVEKPATLGEDK